MKKNKIDNTIDFSKVEQVRIELNPEGVVGENVYLFVWAKDRAGAIKWKIDRVEDGEDGLKQFICKYEKE